MPSLCVYLIDFVNYILPFLVFPPFQGSVTVFSFSFGSETGNIVMRRPRGRPPGSKNKPKDCYCSMKLFFETSRSCWLGKDVNSLRMRPTRLLLFNGILRKEVNFTKVGEMVPENFCFPKLTDVTLFPEETGDESPSLASVVVFPGN
ncbi:hypothetical protein L2E82_40806 [Cichorium intybus]|uniref:Uncharacterized protein n=1 Tax=Cichorium intybus TaxID=13427 RepID=A0ACB9AM49_CICIN|nr:hypothetical protein L2E82_40806 [Cichorium intybus]